MGKWWQGHSRDKPKRKNEEFVIQCQLTAWIKEQYPGILFTVSAGGMRTFRGVAIKLKRLGYSRGTPDIFIEEPRGKYHGLRIELKREKKGSVSSYQRDWLKRLNDRGYKAIVCKGLKESQEAINNYFNRTEPG